MSDGRSTRSSEQDLFEACLAAHDPGARQALLASHPDPAVATRVRRLLDAHDSDPSSLPLPGVLQPRTIGPYRILERIGEGAIGEVFLAEQTVPVRRRVGLKVIKFGLGTREVVARFEIERHTLALMAHPNVARIFDAGTTPEGRPYFAMEYVPGVALTRYCDERRLDVAARLALFSEVCAGVQHAHLRGVIHRDLKPSNILVAEIDGRPVPKIIDFGIAKATTATSEGADVHTRIGHLLGTPEYMSPEQAQLSPLEIDARTDVYSLGVLLYELLTGCRPYAVTHDSFDPGVIAREIVDAEIAPPSVRTAMESPDAGTRASARATTPRALTAQLRGDLDWITLKALDKDRRHRYLSAAELAADLARAGSDQPVSAGPPSTLYALRKFVRRHRVAVAAAVLVLVGFGVGGALSLWQAGVARQQAQRAARAQAFVASIFTQAVPKQGIGGAVLATDLLAVAADRLDRELVDDPAMAAELGMIFAGSYRALGFEQEAEPLLRATVARAERAFGADADLTLDARIELASAMLVRDPGGAVAMLGELRSAVLAGLPQSASRAIRLLRYESMALARLNRRAESYASLNRAIEIADRSLGPYADETIQLLGLLSGTEGRFGDREVQLRHATDALGRATRAFGTQRPHNTLIATERAYADALRENDRPGDAVPILRRVLADQRQLDSAMTVRVRNATLQLGNALMRVGEAGEALVLVREAVAIERQHNAADTDERREYGDALAGALALGNHVDEALAQDAYLDGLVARLGGEPRGAAVYRRLRHARLLVFDGRPQDAQQSVDAAEALVGPAEADLRFQVAVTRAFVVRQLGRLEEAERVLLALRADPMYGRQRLALVAGVEAELGLAYLDQGRADRAAEPLERCERTFVQAQIAPSVRVAGCLLGAARVQLAQGRPAQALRRLEPLLASWEATNPGSPSHGETLYWIAQAQRALGATELADANLRLARRMLAGAKPAFLRRLA